MSMSLVKRIPSYTKICLNGPGNCGVSITRHASGIIHSFYKYPKERVKIPPNFDHIILPAPEHRKLPALEIVPYPPNGTEEMKIARRPYDCNGPETIHNRLLYGQYGLMALSGGHLKPPHLKFIRESVNRYIKKDRFAVWRIDPPWKSITKKSSGHKLGGGKGNVVCFATPIKAGRIILEFGGKCEFEDILKMLLGICRRMPVDALPVHADFFEEFEKELEEKRRKNLNPLTYQYAIENNLADCRRYLGLYEAITGGRYT